MNQNLFKVINNGDRITCDICSNFINETHRLVNYFNNLAGAFERDFVSLEESRVVEVDKWRFNPFITNPTIIQKPVDWFLVRINESMNWFLCDGNIGFKWVYIYLWVKMSLYDIGFNLDWGEGDYFTPSAPPPSLPLHVVFPLITQKQ